jgi:hypothetical protein
VIVASEKEEDLRMEKLTGGMVLGGGGGVTALSWSGLEI